MNGDLGNLLTGEMGEAESRFAYDDFAEAYGRRVAGRVRRRRAVRATAVGGGTMLTAGALVVGATHMPWGVLGAAAGLGGTDCVTPSPSIGHLSYTVTPAESEQIRATTNYEMPTDLGPDVSQGWTQFSPETGLPRLIVAHMNAGTWFVTIGSGEAQRVEPDESGAVTVDLIAGSKTTSYRVESTLGGMRVAEQTTIAVGDAARRASDDCYTPSPTPSPTPSGVPSLTTDIYPIPDPSPAAKPEEVTSPFQCGFTFPTDSHGTGDLWIDGLTWTTADAINAQMKQKFAGHEQDIFAVASGTARIPIVNVTDRIGAVLGLDSYQVSRATVDPRVVQASLGPIKPGDPPLPFEGFTFVAVTDHTVVGTIDPAHPVEELPTLGPNTDPHAISEQQTLLNSEDPFTACPGVTVGNDVDFYAIAGTIAFDSTGVIYEPTYVWLNVGRP